MTSRKICCTCHQAKPTSDFNKRQLSADGLQSRCRACCRGWYLSNRVQHIANAARRKSQTMDELRVKVVSYLLDHPCVDCGERDVRCLDFDHLDPTTKVSTISFMVSQVYSWERIAEELAKCVVRCSNCHRRRTAETRSQWRHQWMVEHGLLPAPRDASGQ